MRRRFFWLLAYGAIIAATLSILALVSRYA